MEGNQPASEASSPRSQAIPGPEVRTYLFGPWRFRSSPRMLEREGRPVDLRPQALQVLDELLSSVGEVVSREQLKDSVFADRPFLDHRQAINLAVLRLRRALGDDARNPTYIETVGRQGYRFIHPVEVSASSLVHPVATSGAAAEALPDGDEDVPGRGLRARLRRLEPGGWSLLVRIGSAILVAGIALSSLSVLGGGARLEPAQGGTGSLSVLEVSPWRSAEAGSEDRSRALTAELVARLHGAASPGWRVRQTGEGSARLGELGIEGSSRPSGARLVVTLRLSRVDDRLQLWSKVETIDPQKLDTWLDGAARELLAVAGRSRARAASKNREALGAGRSDRERGSRFRVPLERRIPLQSIDPSPAQ